MKHLLYYISYIVFSFIATISLYADTSQTELQVTVETVDKTEDINVLFSKALQLFYASQYKEAFSFFEQCIKIAGDKAVPLRYLGILSVHFNNEKDAIVYFQRAIQADIHEKESREFLGELYYKHKQFDKAKDIFQGLLEYDTNSEIALDYLARIASSEKNTKKAIFFYRKLALVAMNTDNSLYVYQAYANLANYYYTIGNYNEAIIYFEKTIAFTNVNEPIYFILGELYRQKGDFKKSNFYFEAIFSNSPRASSIHKSLIENYYILGDKRAFILADTFLKKFDEQVPLINAILLEKNGELDRAMAVLLELTKEDPSLLSAHIGLANIYFKQGDLQNMKTQFLYVIILAQKISASDTVSVFTKKVFSLLDSEDVITKINTLRTDSKTNVSLDKELYLLSDEVYELYLAHASNLEEKKQYKQAVAYYEEAYRYGSTLEQLLIRSSNSEDDEEEDGEALEDIQSQQYQILLSTAWILQNTSLKYYDQSILKAKQAILYAKEHESLNSDISKALFLQGLAYFNKQDYNTSIGIFKNLVNNPDNANVSNYYFYLGMAFDKINNLQEAEKWLKQAIVLSPDNAFYLNYLGYMYVYHNINLDVATNLLKQAFEDDCENEAYLDSLGWLFFRKGNFQAALEYLILSVSFAEKQKSSSHDVDAIIYFHLAEVYNSLNNYSSALNYYEKVYQTLSTSSETLDVKYLEQKINSLKKTIENTSTN